MLKDRLHELLEKPEDVTSESKTDDVDKPADEKTDGRENEAFDGAENDEVKTEDQTKDDNQREKKSEDTPKVKKTEQTEVDIEALERQKAEDEALEEFIVDHKLPDELEKFLDDIGKVSSTLSSKKYNSL